MNTATTAATHKITRPACWLRLCLLLALGGLGSCTGIPDGVEPVSGFEMERYLGKWYEIARLDHSFERGLQQVSAQYSPADDGGVRVLNRGYSPDDGWQSAQGKAYFVGPPDEGYLKVSFFGPFYGSYIVFGLDRENYQYAFVAGNSSSYLWLLARTPTVSAQVKEQFLQRARELGFPVEELIFVDQDVAAGP